MSLESRLHLSTPKIGGLGVGPGIAGDRAWTVAAGVVVLLAALAWWTMRPARRASRMDILRGRRAARDKTSQVARSDDGRSHQ